MSEQRFQPIRGKKTAIDETSIQNGQLLIATDTGEMFLDVSDATRVAIGGSGVSILYANDPNPIELSTNQFNLNVAYVEGQVKVDDLIMNIPDGSFYKVLSLGTTYLFCQRLSISGTGGGGEGGGGVATPKVGFVNSLKDQLKNIYVYGEDFYFTVIPFAEDDTTVNVTIELYNQADSSKAYYSYTKNIKNYSELTINLGAEFQTGTTIVSVGLSTNNSGSTTVRYDGQQVVELRLDEDSFHAESICTDISPIQFRCKPVGKVKKILHVLVDGYEVKTETISESVSDNTSVVNITGTMLQTHGAHSLTAYLTAEIDGQEVISNTLSYQVAYAATGINTPVIWFMSKPETVEQYSDIIVKYMVYDPTIGSSGTMSIEQLHDGVVVTTLDDVQYSASTPFTWVVADYIVGDNYYGISCKGTTESFIITVTPSDRDMDYVQQDQMIMNLSATGRTNNESLLSRQALTYEYNNQTYECQLNNFNWYTNGWSTDSDGHSFLRISDGASLRIPLRDINQAVGIQLNKDATQSYTFEFRLKIRNITSYDTLIKNITKYFVTAKNDYIDWDELVEYATSLGKDPEDLIEYDTVFNSPIIKVEKNVSTSKGICIKYLGTNEKIGFALGTQESYFGTGNEYVNAKYKEDEIFNLSYVISANSNSALSKVYIYVNGLLTGISTISTTGDNRAFDIDNNFIEVLSDYCDVDLYNVRVYKTALDSWAIVQNYLSDLRDVEAYDQNQISNNVNNLTVISYDKLLDYNLEQTNNGTPELLSMPYIVFQTVDNVGETGTYVTDDGTPVNKKNASKVIPKKTTDENLPYIKGGVRYVKVTFTNPALDYAYNSGELAEVAAKAGYDVDEYYAYHCPSFVAHGGELNVQGTSSQAYPRRNYKLKLKNADYWRYSGASRKGEDIDGDGTNVWCMDTNSPAVHNNKWTFKIDYMESSGSYNTGFANMVHYMYDKHPLDYYKAADSDAFSSITDSKVLDTYRTSVQGYPVLTFHAVKDSSGNLQYNYIGRYNMNLDKGSDDAYGYKYDGTNGILGKKFKKIAECWEMSDNQGTYCSFKFPYEGQTGFNGYYNTKGQLEIIDHLEYRYHDDSDNLDICYDFESNVISREELGSPLYEDDIAPYEDAIEAAEDVIAAIRANNTELDAQLSELEAALEINPEDTSIQEQIAVLEDANGITEQRNIIVENEANIKVQSEAWATTKDYNSLIAKRYSNIEKLYKWFAETDIAANPYVDEAALLASGSESAIAKYTFAEPKVIEGTSYQYDTKAYRSAKFIAEFSKHLNEEYCLVYFIMTELLLCYDSRGKNMMIASWGPMEEGGEYIWFPIFYDIDTQLGINNTGIPTWDYDVDASLNATTGSEVYSTPNSVLWYNLLYCFSDKIKAKYGEMRNGKLKQDFIESCYRCDPDTFTTSYACKGVRPLVALNADFEYKYILPTLEVNKGTNYGYITTAGNWVQDTGNSFFYACQGDRDLSRQLLIRNRMNFLDSELQADIYNPQGATSTTSFKLRAGANSPELTSDTFLDKEVLDKDEVTAGFIISPLGENPLDATPYYQITPFLSQYVLTYYDDNNPTVPQKFEAGGSYIQPTPPESIITGYKQTPSFTQQLFYIPGGEFLSKVDGLPTKYIDEIQLGTSKRLTELVLGSDVAGYKNGNLVSITLADAADTVESPNENAKTLLKKVVLTGLTNIKPENAYIEMRGSSKLEEFRALNTNITGCGIATGAPIEILHLPSSIDTLVLNTNYNLTNVITEKLANDIPNSPTATGLYIEKLTDEIDRSLSLSEATASASTSSFGLSTIEIKNDYLGYDSYQLIKTALAKKIALSTATSKKGLKIRCENVVWTPYEVLDSAAEISDEITYYYLNDHYQYVEIDPNTDEKDFAEKRLNSLIFTKNEDKDETQIQSMEMIDTFIDAYKAAVNTNPQFQDSTYSANVPYLSGEIYIDNSNENTISELEVQEYNSYYPSLDIRVANIEKNYTIKFVQVDDVTGLTKIYLVQKASNCKGAAEAGDSEYFANPNRNSTLIPSKNNYDFFGWSTDGTQDNVIIQPGGDGVYYDDVWEAYNFADIAVDNVVTLYAAFELHKYNATFYNYDGSVLGTTQTVYSRTSPINVLSLIPSKPADDLDLYEVYGFDGWAMKSAPTRILDMSTIHPIMDYEFIAVFTEKSVYDNALSSNYVSINNNGAIYVKPGIQLSGKITLPSVVNGITVTSINNGGFQNQTLITHIFWNDGVANSVTTIGDYSFSGCSKLMFYEMREAGQVTVGTQAFANTAITDNFLDENFMIPFLGGIISIGTAAFSRSVADLQKTKATSFIFPGSLIEIGANAFQNHGSVKSITFGSYNDPIKKCMITSGQFPFNRNGSIPKALNMTYYYKLGNDLTETEKDILRASTNSGATVTLNGICVDE